MDIRIQTGEIPGLILDIWIQTGDTPDLTADIWIQTGEIPGSRMYICSSAKTDSEEGRPIQISVSPWTLYTFNSSNYSGSCTCLQETKSEQTYTRFQKS
jgi:hypothetical protein